MNILALETSTEYLSVAIADRERLIARDCRAGQRHSELILPMIAAVLADAGMERRSLDAVAFGAGPGSFTGLRIACGVAQGLAFGLGVPVIPVSTLAAVAQAAAVDKVIVALDARIGEIYHAAFQRQGRREWLVMVEANLCVPTDAPVIAGEGWTGAGNGFAVYEAALSARYGAQLCGLLPGALPHARAIAQLAIAHYEQGMLVTAAEAAPIYVRNKVALTIGEQAARR